MKHISVFSGIGGFDYAAEQMGWENVAHCEINPFCRHILNFYWPNAISYEDIKTTDFTIHRGTIDVLTGGFPCQPFSLAGKRKGTQDDRHLWPEMLRAIREMRPRWIVGENVFGIVNWSDGLVFDEVQADLEAEGYEVQPFILPACSVDAPHRRDRVWFVAHTKSAGDNRKEGIFCEADGRSRAGQLSGFDESGKGFSFPGVITDPCRKQPECNGGFGELGSQEGAGESDPEKREWIRNTTGNICEKTYDTDPNDIDRGAGCGKKERQKANNGCKQPFTNADSEYSSISEQQWDKRATDLNTGGKSESGTTAHADNCNGRSICGYETYFGRESKKITFNSDSGENESIANADQFGCEGFKESQTGQEPVDRSHWSIFPTQSALCDGNDGIAARLDPEAVFGGKVPKRGTAFGKWRGESIKGGGNAIVWQVAHQIFLTIKEYELLTNQVEL